LWKVFDRGAGGGRGVVVGGARRPELFWGAGNGGLVNGEVHRAEEEEKRIAFRTFKYKNIAVRSAKE